jgi:hypothetical protein
MDAESLNTSANDWHESAASEPIAIQASKVWIVALTFLSYGTAQWIGSYEKAGYGILEYWTQSTPSIPNDYKLLVLWSTFSIALVVALTSTAPASRNKINAWLLGPSSIVPVVASALMMLFFFYLILFRGLWPLKSLLTDFSSLLTDFVSLNFVTIILALYGSKGLFHWYRLRQLAAEGRTDEVVAYALKYKLDKY